MANKLRVSGQIQDKDRYISISETKRQMVAMLTDIQLDIEGQKFDTHIDKDVWNDAIRVCSDLIQQRINELKQEPTTKNDLGVDCVARQDVERFIEGFINEYTPEEELEFIN